MHVRAHREGVESYRMAYKWLQNSLQTAADGRRRVQTVYQLRVVSNGFAVVARQTKVAHLHIRLTRM